ncbi:Na/Pi cotransporter family protein [uncultured Thomasclavelia sp.]|uniref:Na/Pi cotransporter family protein n=1 Tax=uncultured Thomasclavelia sp. TaxID=3025759 RepID=UPI0025D204FC|nr:Na/Pi cotransporter family protein [uncultured Thomasclavelia sp.]
MKLTDIFSLLGGLALFLYGMTMMSNGLELAAGNKMKSILERLTANRFIGVAVGALITAVIQSSSATTVMVVGFVNAGLMSLERAVWIIMGANIGTTITGQLIAIDITALAPIIAFVGVVFIAFFKSKRLDAIGTIIAGLGILFMGMEMMSTAMEPLRDSPTFINIVSTFKNPLVGILVGAGFTAIIQSSSASVGILQALAKSGVVTLDTGIYVLFGQNIGTCITAVLASIGTSRNAKRTTIIHLSFNIIGTIIFVIISMVTPFASFMQSLTPTNIPAQIANVHTIFNVVTTIILLPFGNQLVKLTYLVLPEKEGMEDKMTVKYLDSSVFTNDYNIGRSAIVNQQLFNETQNMLANVQENVQRSFELMVNYDEEKYEKVLKYEEYIDYLNKEIIQYTTTAISSEFPVEESQSIGLFLKTSGDLERIGDHAINIAARAKSLHENNEHFSPEAMEEISIMSDMTRHILAELSVLTRQQLHDIVGKVDVIEDQIDAITKDFSLKQLKRLRDKKCTPENSALFTETLIDFERIGDHGLNIAAAFDVIKEELTMMA